jgi:hypothetical protein
MSAPEGQGIEAPWRDAPRGPGASRSAAGPRGSCAIGPEETQLRDPDQIPAMLGFDVGGSMPNHGSDWLEGVDCGRREPSDYRFPFPG